MAERRMFTKKIIDSDAFLDMPLSTQALYFHLNMRADDDGFLNNAKKIQRMIGASEDDLKLLIAKRFVLGFESGVIVIKHWRMHNLLRKDRYNPTHYKEEFAMLGLKDNGSYTEKIAEIPSDNQLATTWQPEDIQTDNQLATQDRLGKDSIDKDIYKTIVDYLNQKTGQKYKPSTKKTQTCIHARLAEGFTEDDFKKVIDNKCAEWIGTEWEKYLRPETLFGTKFESYLNAKIYDKGAKQHGTSEKSNTFGNVGTVL